MNTIKVKMLMNINHKVNGERMGPYSNGQEYDLPAERARLFIGSAMAEEVIPEPVVEDESEAAAGEDGQPLSADA